MKKVKALLTKINNFEKQGKKEIRLSTKEIKDALNEAITFEKLAAKPVKPPKVERKKVTIDFDGLTF